MIVENAKQHIATAVKTETQLPYVEVNPRIVSSAPAAAPYETGIPLQRITVVKSTDDDGVCKYFKDPKKSLFDRFTCICASMCDRTGTKTCFIREDTSGYTFFHAHKEASYCSACNRSRGKRSFKE